MLFYFRFRVDGRKRFEYATCGPVSIRKRQKYPRPETEGEGHLPSFIRLSALPQKRWGNEGTRLNITLYRSTMGKTARVKSYSLEFKLGSAFHFNFVTLRYPCLSSHGRNLLKGIMFMVLSLVLFYTYLQQKPTVRFFYLIAFLLTHNLRRCNLTHIA